MCTMSKFILNLTKVQHAKMNICCTGIANDADRGD